jgi:hypothetical protein
MVSLTSLWLPILLSAVLVFVVSSVIHMALGYHKHDWQKLPAEDEVLEALRKFRLPPGDYMAPRPGSSAEANSPGFKARWEKGPRLVMTVLPSAPGMGRQLILWFLYAAVVSVFAAYVAGVVLAPGTEYLAVFRITGAVAFAGYALALWQAAIWYGRNMTYTLLSTLDGLVYALVTGGTFGWLWP